MESDTGQWMNESLLLHRVLLWATDCLLCGLGLIRRPFHVTMGSARGLQVPCTGDPEGATWWPPHAPWRLVAGTPIPPSAALHPRPSAAGAGRGGRGRGVAQPLSVSALDKGCYFSCHVCWGPAQVCFSCRKAGRPIWNTHNSHVIGGGSPSAWHWLPDS